MITISHVEGTPVMPQDNDSDALPFKVTYFDWKGDKTMIERRLISPNALASEWVNRVWNEGGGDVHIDFSFKNRYGASWVDFRASRLDVIGKDAGIRELTDALTPG